MIPTVGIIWILWYQNQTCGTGHHGTWAEQSVEGSLAAASGRTPINPRFLNPWRLLAYLLIPDSGCEVGMSCSDRVPFQALPAMRGCERVKANLNGLRMSYSQRFAVRTSRHASWSQAPYLSMLPSPHAAGLLSKHPSPGRVPSISISQQTSARAKRCRNKGR